MPMKKEAVERPTIESLEPFAAIPGGDLHIRGRHFATAGHPSVSIGVSPVQSIVAGDSYIIARVPESIQSKALSLKSGELQSKPCETHIGVRIADSLHPVGNPALDADGNIYSTFSGSRGQKSPVSIYKIDTSYNSKPFVTDLMNPTGLAFDREGVLYASSRYDGIVYQIAPSGNMSVYVEGMGVATGIAFDHEQNLYVGDRSGTIFKISRSRQIYVFATLEPSIAAYHLAFGPDGDLFVTGPTTSSFDTVYVVSKTGEVGTFYRGLGRPQGLAFDNAGNLYVAASLRGRRGITRFDPNAKPEQFVSGPGIVGLAFAPGGGLILATHNALFRVETGVAGLSLI